MESNVVVTMHNIKFPSLKKLLAGWQSARSTPKKHMPKIYNKLRLKGNDLRWVAIHICLSIL